MTERLCPIGEVAERVGVSTRTLRYYEELGLVVPSGRSPGGSRRYAEADIQRVLRIRELQSLMGFDLDQIRAIVLAESRLDELRSEYQRGSRHRQDALLVEAMQINRQLRAQLDAKLTVLERFRDELDAKADRYRLLAAERGIELPEAGGVVRA